MEKISYQAFLELLANPEISDAKLREYCLFSRGDSAFDIKIKPNPEKVEMSSTMEEFESAMGGANSAARLRRRISFKKRSLFGSDLPVLVSEGDSWFQFPILIDEVVDQLGEDYLIWSVGAAGDTAKNMVYGAAGRAKKEYITALRAQKDRVRGFMFSAAGNDIIGEDPEDEIPVLRKILKTFNGDTSDVTGHVDEGLLSDRLNFLRDAYTQVINDIRIEPGFERLPIFVHGYDYVFPYPASPTDPRSPIYADKDEWLGQPMTYHGINDPDHRREIIKYLLDRLHELLRELAGDSPQTGVWHVDCRGAMPDVSDWADEIHGTSAGFAKVAARFRPVIEKALQVASS
jgi:N-acetylmuramoyl-L-alanine amidase